MFFFSDNLSRRSMAVLVILLIMLTLLFENILLPAQQAKAQLEATVIEQIIQFIQQIAQYVLDQISWAKDYVTQNLQKYYSQITSQIQQWTKSDILEQRSLKDSWNKTRAELLKELSNNILDWAKGQNGDTNFVTDWKGYLGGKVVTAGQNVADKNIPQSEMSDQYKGKVQEIIKAEAQTPAQTFQQESKCPVQDPSAFYSDFSQGGYDTWLQMLLPGCNFLGSLLLADDLRAEEQAATYAAEQARLIANQGFKGDETKGTPGIVQSYATQRASMMDFDYLLNSPDINEYLSSIVDAFINRIKTEGLKNLATTGYTTQCQSTGNGVEYVYDAATKTCKPKVVVPQQAQDLNFIKENRDYFYSMASDGLQILLDDLIGSDGLQAKQQANLSLLEQIQTTQQQLTQHNCATTTASVDNEISQLEKEITDTKTMVAQINTALKDIGPVVVDADAVIKAAAAGGSFDSEMTRFKNDYAKLVNDSGTGSLQILLKTTETDPKALNDQLGNLAKKIVDATTKLIKKNPQTCPNPNVYVSNISNNVTGTLCEQLAKEQYALKRCGG